MKIKTRILALAMLVTFASVNATSLDGDEKVIAKARKAVERTQGNNWKVFATSANMVIEKKIALTEAKKWLDASMKIQETPFNLEIMGDYYRASGDNRKAMSYYVKSIVLLKTLSTNPKTERIQAKIWKSR